MILWILVCNVLVSATLLSLVGGAAVLDVSILSLHGRSLEQKARENLHTSDCCLPGSPRTSRCVSMRMYTTDRSWRSRR